jgi:hypothetical protein
MRRFLIRPTVRIIERDHRNKNDDTKDAAPENEAM